MGDTSPISFDDIADGNTSEPAEITEAVESEAIAPQDPEAMVEETPSQAMEEETTPE